MKNSVYVILLAMLTMQLPATVVGMSQLDKQLFTAVCCYEPDLGNISLLIAEGANVKARQDDGCTVLHLAAVFGNATCIRMLLNEIRAKDKAGLAEFVNAFFWPKCDNSFKAKCVTALHLAISLKQNAVECVKLLLGAGADVNAVLVGSNNTKETAVDEACGYYNGSLDVMLSYCKTKKIKIKTSRDTLDLLKKRFISLEGLPLEKTIGCGWW